MGPTACMAWNGSLPLEDRTLNSTATLEYIAEIRQSLTCLKEPESLGMIFRDDSHSPLHSQPIPRAVRILPFPVP